MQVETLFILRRPGEPLHPGDVIEADGMHHYRITVKEIINTEPVGEKVRWEIRGTRDKIE